MALLAGRCLTLLLLLCCLFAGLGTILSAALALRAAGTAPIDDLRPLIMSMALVMNMGAALMALHLFRQEPEREFLDMGRRARAWLLGVCYAAGIAIALLCIAWA